MKYYPVKIIYESTGQTKYFIEGYFEFVGDMACAYGVESVGILQRIYQGYLLRCGFLTKENYKDWANLISCSYDSERFEIFSSDNIDDIKDSLYEPMDEGIPIGFVMDVKNWKVKVNNYNMYPFLQQGPE
jgi:hypothetical protein